jgi:TPP-dependent pyruvate/acetoin dehydrogenase alpha subunit
VVVGLLQSMYVSMLRIRLFEERVADLIEAKEIRTPVHLCIGQEGVAVGVCASLRRHDTVWVNHRSHGHYLAKGGDMSALMAEIFCRLDGCAGGLGGSMHVVATEVGILGTVPMVGATVPIAVGAALSAKMQGHEHVAVSFFGYGATEEGVIHEALNFATLNKLPVVFVCENNGYSSHLPLSARRAVGELHLHALPYGIPGLRVDGNDVQTVYDAASQAVERARRGEGPTLLECMTYRWRGHVGPRWDLDVGIRDEEELASWMAHCPIRSLEASLKNTGVLTPDALEALKAEVVREVDTAVDFARRSSYPSADTLLEHVFVGQE